MPGSSGRAAAPSTPRHRRRPRPSSGRPRPDVKILFVASEAAPFVKTGGLGDVIGALPRALAKRGHELRCVVPKYGSIDAQKSGLRDTGRRVEVQVPRLPAG